MFCKLLITIVLIKTYTVKIVQSQYLETELNLQKPKIEKNNIVNKGVWVRNKFNDDILGQEGANNFIFRENSLDVDNLLQNNFDAFGGNYMQDIPFVSAYAERQKRSSRYWNKRPRKSITGKNIKTRLSRQNNEFENIDSAQLKVINDLQPSSVFTDYPYEVAIISNGNITKEIDNNYTLKSTTQSNPNNNDIILEPTTKSIDTVIKNTSNESSKNITSPKRSMKYDFESEIIKKIEFTEDLNKTENNDDNKIMDRSNVFDKDNSEWHQNAPIPNVNMYKVVPKEPMHKSKPVTERGLLKVISMLTKTFKKIIKEHNEIKLIHNSITDISDEFKKNTALFASKFQDFDLKYLYLLKFHDKMKEFDEKLANREEYFLNKEKDMAKNFKEFENQQKKFLIQQKQFYNIQKLMLAQNEKINSKQNSIAKTQSEISHRQNNFARILKKAKQLYTDRSPTITKLSSTINKMKDTTPKTPEYPPPQMHISTQAPEITTESIKINLFSIPTSNKLKQDPDELLLKEKDDQAIDDLVYKYYFNNTFIDSFMRSKILNSFMGNTENGGNISSAKHKRNNLETTILLPVIENNESEIYGHKRDRRWINRHRSRHSKRRRDKKTTPTYVISTYVNEKPANVGIPLNMIETEPIKENNVKNDPFMKMAESFCNEIHQNSDKQTLRWCIEKALRRLKFLETGMMPSNQTPQPQTTSSVQPSTTVMKNLLNNKQKILLNMILPDLNIGKEMTTSEIISTTNEAPSVTTASLQASENTTPPIVLTPLTLQTVAIPYTNSPPHVKASPDTWTFPDNDELELKIKEEDMTPDTEGNVYYEGSIHASDIIVDSESGVDDIMPGLDSNSRVEVDPLAFDLQAKRRASVRKLNERIKKSLV